MASAFFATAQNNGVLQETNQNPIATTERQGFDVFSVAVSLHESGYERSMRNMESTLKRSSVYILAINIVVFALCLATASTAWGGEGIPKAAWKRPLGLPLKN